MLLPYECEQKNVPSCVETKTNDRETVWQHSTNVAGREERVLFRISLKDGKEIKRKVSFDCNANMESVNLNDQMLQPCLL